jgi:N-acetylglucosamine-6-phosphate deacetylase
MTHHRSPGLFDLQANGFAGVDFNDAALTAHDVDQALEAMLACGTTLCLPTIITAHAYELEVRFAALDRAVAEARFGPLMVPGYHLEGPFLNPAEGYAGCHPTDAMIAADPALVERIEAGLSRPILMVTVAPEIEGALAFTRWAAARGKVVAIGHSNADAETIARAAEAGAKLSTHLGNGIAHTHDKFANPLFAQLIEDRLSASFIADGIHIPPHVLKVLMRARGFERSILVTDAVAAAGAPDGLYRLAGMTVERRSDGSVRLPGSAYLAGSALTLDQAVRNCVAWGLADFADAIRMASDHPCALMAEAFARHNLVPPASSVVWSESLGIVETTIGGARVYERAHPSGG